MAKSEAGKGETTYLKPVLSRKQIVINNFIGGLSWALGSIVGLAVVAAIVGFFLNFVDLKLILGDWLGGIIKQAISQFEPAKLK